MHDVEFVETRDFLSSQPSLTNLLCKKNPQVHLEAAGTIMVGASFYLADTLMRTMCFHTVH